MGEPRYQVGSPSPRVKSPEASGITTSPLETLHSLEEGFACKQIRQVNPLLLLSINPMMLPSSPFCLVILMLHRPADWPLYPIAMAV